MMDYDDTDQIIPDYQKVYPIPLSEIAKALIIDGVNDVFWLVKSKYPDLTDYEAHLATCYWCGRIFAYHIDSQQFIEAMDEYQDRFFGDNEDAN